jgi:hypothetical protein
MFSGVIASQSSSSIIQTGEPSGILAKLRAAFRQRVPAGYEDETGFHLGMEPAQNESGCSCPVQDLNESRMPN